MKKKLLAVLATGLFMFGMVGLAQASLTTIGFAFYDDDFGNIGAYKMIYDDDSPLGPITWMDYSHSFGTWQSQMDWTASLNNPDKLQYFFLNGITMDWQGEDWRLPSAANNPQGGYNQPGSEMGHLFYTELGLNAGSTTAADLNAGEFNNLIASWYWSGTEYANNPDDAWFFDMSDGYQGVHDKNRNFYGLAVISGQVSVIPIPGAVWLLGSGLAGLAGLRRKKKK